MIKTIGSIILCLFFTYSYANQTIHLNNDQKIINLNQFYWLEDVQSQFSIQQIIGKPEQDWTYTDTTPNFGITQSTYWLHVKIINNNLDTRWLLEVAYPLLDNITFYYTENSTLLYSSKQGDYYPFKQRPILHRNFLEPIKGKKIDLYIQVKSSGSMALPMTLWEEQTFYSKQQNSYLILGLYYGIMFIMIIYNLLLFTLVREKSYIYYVLYVFSETTLQAAIHGLTYQYIFSELPRINAHIIVFSLASSYLFIALFVIEFLQLKIHLPKFYRYFQCNIIFYLFMAIFSVWIPYPIAIKLQILFGLPLFLVSFTVGVIMLRNGHTIAKHFTLAWSIFLITGILYALFKIGLLPYNAYTSNAVQFGFVAVAVLLSVALAHRINHLKTERSQMKQIAAHAQTENEKKSRFLAIMSHELRTPMNGVLGMLQLLKNTKLDKQQKNYINVINRSGHLLLKIINDILDFSKISANKITIESHCFDCHQLFIDSKKQFHQQCVAKNIKLTLHINPIVPQYIQSDATRLTQIINNILSNAVKFTQNGEINIDVHCNETKKILRLRIKDTGIGLSIEQQKTIFDEYSQADISTTRKYGGTGLGLTICQKLSQLMGGNIKVVSQLNQGTLFQVTIQYKTAEITTKTSEENKQPVDITQLNILIAEDDEINRMVILGMLKELGATHIKFAKNGEIAVQYFQKNSVDIIFMDCEMPVMDGYLATKLIREYELKYRLNPVKIVAVSAHSMEKYIENCIAAGMNGFLSKPYVLEQLKHLFT